MFTAYADVEGAMDYGLTDKEVTFYWKRSFPAFVPEVKYPPSLTPDGGFVSSQKEATAFWPTEVCGFGVDKVCVAGKTVTGKTRIQLWTLDSSGDLGEPYTNSSGVIKYPETFLPVLSKVNLYDAWQPGRQLVRTMFQNYGTPGKLFVQFDDSRDLWQLDTSSGVMVTVLTTGQQPLLERDFSDRWSAHHTQGFMYAWDWRGEILLLFDQDLDGVLDPAATRHLTGDQWYAGPVDFSDASGYLEQY